MTPAVIGGRVPIYVGTEFYASDGTRGLPLETISDASLRVDGLGFGWVRIRAGVRARHVSTSQVDTPWRSWR